MPWTLQTLTYSSREALPLGARVQVTLRQRQVWGIVWEACAKPADLDIKPIEALLDQEALLDADLRRFLQFTARYYARSLGDVLESALPLPLRRQETLPQWSDVPVLTQENIQLTPAQQRIADALPRQAGVCVLEGVTGSGKSEIYAHYLSERLREGQALVLTPEIGLTPALFETLQKRTGRRGALYHSHLTPQKRAKIWAAARAGALDFIVGTRSAVFLPFQNLNSIVVDEEHDLSYKQQEALRYHARDLAVLRAHHLRIPVILGSATPSLEALHRVKLGQWQHLYLPERAKTQQRPQVVLDDGRSGRVGVLSMRLITAMRQTIQDGGQVLLFLNRRGFASVLQCPQCDYRNECPHCDRLMTIHLRRGVLHCHHCQHQQALPPRCPKCQNHELEVYGLGTERLEKTVAQQFPQARVMRIDSDEYRTPKRFAEALEVVKRGEVDIVLGTQWLTKGHHLPRMKLVAVVDADQALHSVDFRCEERLLQLLLQVGGRTGREGAGTIWIQTRQPQQAIFSALTTGYQAQSQRLYRERQEALLPPHSAQVLLAAQHRQEANALHTLLAVQTALTALPKGCFCLGPVPALLARRAGFYRYHLIVQAPQKSTIQALLPELQTRLQEAAKQHHSEVMMDVDPMILD